MLWDRVKGRNHGTNFLQGSVFRFCIQEASLSAPRRRILKPDCELESAGGLFLSSFQTSNLWTHPWMCHCALGGLEVQLCDLHLHERQLENSNAQTGSGNLL